MTVVASTSSFIQTTAPSGSNPNDSGSVVSIFDALLAAVAPMATEPNSATPTATLFANLPAIAPASDSPDSVEQSGLEEDLPETLSQLGGNSLPAAVLSDDDLDESAGQRTGVGQNAKTGHGSPAISPEPRTQRSERVKTENVRESSPDNAAPIALPATASIAQALAAAIEPGQVAIGDSGEPRVQHPMAGTDAPVRQTPAAMPVGADSALEPQNTATHDNAAALSEGLTALPGKTPAADIGNAPQILAASAEQKPAGPSGESRSKTETEKKPTPGVAAVSKGETQEPPALISATAQPRAEDEKGAHSDRRAKIDSAASSPRAFTAALSAQGENSAAPLGGLQTSASNHAAPADFAAANAALAIGAAHDGETPLRLSLNTGGIAAESDNWDGLALKIAAKSAGGESNFQIRLDPPSLGRIEIHLNMDSQGNAQAQLSADRPQTLEFLQRDASALERALKDSGLDLAGGLSFSLKGDGKSGAWRDAQNASRSRAMQIGAVDAANDGAGAAAMIGAGGRAWGSASARLDIRV